MSIEELRAAMKARDEAAWAHSIRYRHGDDVWVCTMTREDSCD